MTRKHHNIDTATDRSDVMSLLETIETMYNTCQNVLNTYTKTSMMLAITIEAKMLHMKLQVMKERWQYHLPFKEACTVDFYDWGKKIEKMSLSFVGPGESGEADEMLTEYCPSKHFMLDLYTMLPENTATDDQPDYFREMDINKLVNSQDKILKLITKKWPEYKDKFSHFVAMKVNSRAGGAVQPLADRSINIQMTCCEVLQQLSATLYELYNMPKDVIQRDQFARLAERVVNESGYGGRKAQQAARRDVDNLKNITPEDEWEQRREEEIQASIDFINELKYGRQVFTFLGRNYDINGRYAGLGKFFNSVRKDISPNELSLLIEQLYRIQYFLEEKRQTEMAATDPQQATENEESEKENKQAQMNIAGQGQVIEDASTDNPPLPDFFDHDLRMNAEATAVMLKRLKAVGKYLGRNLTKEEKEGPARPYVKWKWNHLLQAFKDLELIDVKTTQSEFANFLVQILPDRKVPNILQSFYRNCDKMNPSTVKDVKDVFILVKQKNGNSK